MEKKVDLIIILFITVLVCGALYLVYDNTDDFSVSQNSNITMSRGDEFRIIPRRALNGGTWTVKEMNNDISSSRPVRVSPNSYKRSSMQATSSNSSLVSSSLSLMSNRTSGTVSLVGGGTTIFGRTAEANVSSPLAYSGGAGYPSMNVPSMRSANPVVVSAPTYVVIDAGVMSAPSQFQSFSLVSVPNYGGRNLGFSIVGGVSNNQTATASPLRAGGQSRAPGSGVFNPWEKWLDNGWENDNGYGSKDQETGDIIFTDESAKEAWEAMMADGSLDDVMSGLNEEEAYKDFLEWLKTNGGKYQYVPVGDIAPLFLLTFAYLVMMLIRRKIN